MSYMNRKRHKIIGFIFIISVVVFGFYLLVTSTERKLAKIGYSADEINFIVSRLDATQMSPILENEYLPEMRQILESQTTPADFRSEKLNEYIQAQRKYSFDPKLTVQLVNHSDYDSDEKYNERRIHILYEEYYLPQNKDRYFALETKNAEMSENEIIARVNANRDRDYYTDTMEANALSGHLMLVNKYYFLDRAFEVDLVEQNSSYGSVGERMEAETYAAFEKMFQAAQDDGYQLYVTSGYRGYDEQTEVFATYLAEGGEVHALQYAAKPGYSEHQTGRAIDIFTPGETTKTFAASPVAKWLAEHAYKYGFILRYPAGKEDITGYNFEPWHYRYVGQEAAADIQQRNITLEEYVAVFNQ